MQASTITSRIGGSCPLHREAGRARAHVSTLILQLLSALTIAAPALAAQPALTPVPGSERSWVVTLDLHAPEFAEGVAREFAVSLPSKSAAQSVDPRSLSITSQPGQTGAQPVTVALEGAESQASRLAIVRGPGVQSLAPLQTTFTARAWNTSIDEQVARSREWPEAAWSSDLMPYLQPDDQVESEILPIRTFVKAIAGNDPRSQPPYALAKHLAAAAIDHCRNSSPAAATPSDSPEASLSKIVMARAATDRELPIFLCAIYRAAGLPARVIWGVDVEMTDSGETLPCRRAWVEFLLPGEKGSDGEWIPVDIVRQRHISPRAPSPIPPWEWFGNNPSFANVIPVAASPAAAPHDSRLQIVALSPGCPTCPDRAERSRSDNRSAVQVRPAVKLPDR